jgi:hypothetical protein
MRFSALLSTTYIRASTLNIITLPIICAGIIFKVGFFENSTLFASLTKQAFNLSGSYINFGTGK